MVKRILVITVVSVLSAGLFAGYFYHVGKMVRRDRECGICRNLKITVTDSLVNNSISTSELYDLLSDMTIGRKVSEINIYELKKKLDSRGEVHSSKVYIRNPESVAVEISQREPLVRFEGKTYSLYSDDECYLFPVAKNIDVPVVTGNIPLSVKSGYNGYVQPRDSSWLADMINLGKFLASDEYWNKQVEQIDIAQNGDLVFYTNAGKEKIIFGKCSDISHKFKKLEAYYKNILPSVPDSCYKIVNLEFKNQIICK